MDIKKRWLEHFSSNADDVNINQAYSHIYRKYSEPQRYYHTLEHIHACLDHFDQVAHLLSDCFNLETAIWFHDVIYDPKKNDNEQKSAEYAKSFLQSIGLDETEINKINRLILLTQHPSDPKTEDERYLLDIDLSILGANKVLYDRYEHWIRKEYAFVPKLLYKKGRESLLNSFTSLDRIYHTDYFYQKYEAQARQNIGRALLNLDGS